MTTEHTSAKNCSVETPSGRVRYTEQGTGLVALILPDVLPDDNLSRCQTALSDMRRVIAVDLLAQADVRITPELNSDKASAKMLGQFLQALHIDQVDLVGTGNRCDVAQIFAATHPERMRSLTLTDRETCNDWSPDLSRTFVGLVASGHLRDSFSKMLPSKQEYECLEASEENYEALQKVTDEMIHASLRLFVSNDRHTGDREQFITGLKKMSTVAIVSLLKELEVPSLLVWRTGEGYYGTEWSHSLARTIPGTLRRVEFIGTKILLPEEPEDLDRDLRSFWQKVDQELKAGHANA
jgi:pimeloyl-ACP methyl ester carboxylesterase